MKRRPKIWLIALGTSGVILLGLLMRWSMDPRSRAEREHGLSLPDSAQEIQNRGDAWKVFLDRGMVTLFQLPEADLPDFLSQLSVESGSNPAIPSGDPLVNGWNVWPQGSSTFVPGNSDYGGLRKTWAGSAKPLRMLSCESLMGDWLHVEVWELGGANAEALVKLYTDWN